MRILFYTLLVILVCAACGAKGPLYLPDPNQKQDRK